MVYIKQLMQNTFNGKYIKQLLFFSKFLISIGIPTKFIPYFKMMTPVYIYYLVQFIHPSSLAQNAIIGIWVLIMPNILSIPLVIPEDKRCMYEIVQNA